MKYYSLTIMALLAFTFTQAAAQDKKKDAVEAPAPAPTQTLKPALEFGLQDGTPVRLRIARNLSSADAKVGETVDFDVLDEVKHGETVIIPRGSIAWATVTEAQPKRRMGRAGKLNVNIDNVRLLTGEKVALRAVKELSGGGNTGKMTGAIVATSIVFFSCGSFVPVHEGERHHHPQGDGDHRLHQRRRAA